MNANKKRLGKKDEYYIKFNNTQYDCTLLGQIPILDSSEGSTSDDVAWYENYFVLNGDCPSRIDYSKEYLLGGKTRRKYKRRTQSR